MRLLLPLLACLTLPLVAGCASVPSSAGNSSPSTTEQAYAAATDADLDDAARILRSLGFIEEDFGGEDALRSAAVMLASVGAEWRAFDHWSAQMLDPKLNKQALGVIQDPEKAKYRQAKQGIVNSTKRRKDLPEALRPLEYFPSCFHDDGRVKSEREYVDTYSVINHRTYRYRQEEYQSCLATGGQACLDGKAERSFEDFIAYKAQEAPDHERERASRDYRNNCVVSNSLAEGFYTIHLHSNDLVFSLVAAAAPRVGAWEAFQWASNALAMVIEPSGRGEVFQQYYQWMLHGAYPAIEKLRPFEQGAYGRFRLGDEGGMCTAIHPHPNNYVLEVDDIAKAMGAVPDDLVGPRFHCIAFTDGNWRRVANMVQQESELLIRVMSLSRPAFSSYRVPSWSFPSPGYIEDGTRANHVEHRGYTNTGRAIRVRPEQSCYSHSGTIRLKNKACDALTELNQAYKVRQEFFLGAGRSDAIRCSRGFPGLSGTSGNVLLENCPKVYTHTMINAGEHRR